MWPAIAGLLVAFGFLLRAGIGVLSSLPDEQRNRIRDTMRRRSRVLSVAGVVLAWTLVYGLYSMTLPPRIVAEAGESPAQVPIGTGVPVPTSPDTTTGGPIAAPPTDVDVPEDVGALPPVIGVLPPPAKGDVQAPCSVKDTSDTVREAQQMIEALTGRPLGTDGAVLIDALAGCVEPTTAALSLLGPINTILSQIGILPETIDLPNIDPIVVPTVPEEIAAPLRPVVFEVCAEASRQLVTVGALSIFLHLDYNDLVAMFRNVDAICSAFAPAGSSE